MILKQDLITFFSERLQKLNREGDLKITRFDLVFRNLMPIQQKKLRDFCGDNFQDFLENGSVICIALAYNRSEILAIDQRTQQNKLNRDQWNVYASAYTLLNKYLNGLASEIADFTGGIPVLATLEDKINVVKHVNDYFPLTISHRFVAESAGLGWRGKNGLIIHPLYSCGIRLASILTPLTLAPDERIERSCADCTACHQACSFLKNQEKLTDYRENCRKFIQKLDLADEVCGKCIKACYIFSKFNDQFLLPDGKI
ncbi:MAG: hypothetical protein ACFFD4_27805 [Candidatus Odinarchaeota archaeon]